MSSVVQVGQRRVAASMAASRAALEQLLLAQPLLQPLPAAPERLVDRLGRRGQAALQDRQREADGALPAFVLRGRRPG